MRVNNTQKWEYTEALNTMLFFAQRMDELLFHHSTDSYRYPVLSIIGICEEYLRIYEDSEKEIIHEKNLTHILDEFRSRLKEDSAAINLLTKEYKERFEKGVGGWSKREKYENILFVLRKLGGRRYYSEVVNILKNCIRNNTEKRLVDRYAGIMIRLLIDEGYDENYIYNCIHDIFFHQRVETVDSFDQFVSRFSFKSNQYDVYIGFSQDLSSLIPLFKKLKTQDVEISKIEDHDRPKGIKAKGQKMILKFENVYGLDVFSAYGLVRSISTIIVNAYGYYSHIKNKVKINGQIIDKNGKITAISDHELLKHRVSAMSHEESATNADEMLNIAFTTFLNMREISKVTEIHNAAVCSENTSDALLSLWSIAESLSGSEERDKIQKVKESMMPFLKSTYIEKLVKTCMMDIMRWDISFFETKIRNAMAGYNDLEATFAFLVLDEFDAVRKELYAGTELFPLLRQRVYFLNAQLGNTKGYCSILQAHVQRVEWQIHRIYRARNYIIHDGKREDSENQELVINLHSYIDIMFSKIIELLIKSPYRADTIEDVVIEHKLKTSIMDEQCRKLSKEKIEKADIRKYLYYDFEL